MFGFSALYYFTLKFCQEPLVTCPNNAVPICVVTGIPPSKQKCTDLRISCPWPYNAVCLNEQVPGKILPISQSLLTDWFFRFIFPEGVSDHGQFIKEFSNEPEMFVGMTRSELCAQEMYASLCKQDKIYLYLESSKVQAFASSQFSANPSPPTSIAVGRRGSDCKDIVVASLLKKQQHILNNETAYLMAMPDPEEWDDFLLFEMTELNGSFKPINDFYFLVMSPRMNCAPLGSQRRIRLLWKRTSQRLLLLWWDRQRRVDPINVRLLTSLQPCPVHSWIISTSRWVPFYITSGDFWNCFRRWSPTPPSDLAISLQLQIEAWFWWDSNYADIIHALQS